MLTVETHFQGDHEMNENQQPVGGVQAWSVGDIYPFTTPTVGGRVTHREGYIEPRGPGVVGPRYHFFNAAEFRTAHRAAEAWAVDALSKLR